MQCDHIAAYLVREGFRPDLKGFYCLVYILEIAVSLSDCPPVCKLYNTAAESLGITYYCAEARLRRLVGAYNAEHKDASYFTTGDAVARLAIALRCIRYK